MDKNIEITEVTACRGEYAKVMLCETDHQDAGILAIENSAGVHISAILNKRDLRILRTKITDILNMPVKKP